MNNINSSNALTKLSYGLYLVSSRDGDHLNAFVSNTVFQVSSNPVLLTICSNKQNLTTDLIKKSKRVGISVLNQSATLLFIAHFGFQSGRKINKFEKYSFELGNNQMPLVKEHTSAFIEGCVLQTIELNEHVLFIVEMTSQKVIDENTPVLTYDYYHTVIKGKSPPQAPTFQFTKENTSKIEEKHMKKYKCTVCGYVYDPNVGDPDSGIKPGTAFDDIPASWSCPLCGVTKSDFIVDE